MQKCLCGKRCHTRHTHIHTHLETGSVRNLPLLMRLSFPFHESYNVSVKRLKTPVGRGLSGGIICRLRCSLDYRQGDPPPPFTLLRDWGAVHNYGENVKNLNVSFIKGLIYFVILILWVFDTNIFCCVFFLGLSVLQLKLQQRRTREELVSQGIMPRMYPSSPSALCPLAILFSAQPCSLTQLDWIVVLPDPVRETVCLRQDF